MADITKIDLIFLGSLYLFQSLIIYLGPIIAAIDPALAELLTGISNWPGTADLVSNFGINYTLIIGIFGIVSGIGLMKEVKWAWGQAMIVLSFIIIQTAVSFVSSLASGNLMNITSIINLLMLVVAVTGIVVEKPWHRSENLDLKIWVAAISYDQINSEKLAEHFNVKPQVLVDKTVEMIAKNKIEGQIRFPIFYFDCPENRKRLKEKDTKSKQKNSSAPSTTKKMKKEKRTEDKIQKEKEKTPKGIPKKKIKPNSDDNSPETKTTTRKKRDLKFIKTLSAKFTIISLFLLGLFITYQAVILYLLPLLASLDPVLAEFLSGVSPPFPTLQELITNYGVTYTLIIGSYTLISAFAIKRKTDWAYGTLFTILFFIIFDNLVSLIASIINASPMDVVTFLGIIILSIALLAIAKERPWNVTRQLDYNLLASSKSYDKIKSETLASNLNVKLDYLLNRLRQLITDGKIEGSIDLSTIYFDTEKNKAKIL